MANNGVFFESHRRANVQRRIVVLVIVILLALFIWSPSQKVVQYIFGSLGGGVGSFFTNLRSGVSHWHNGALQSSDLNSLKEQNASLIKENADLKEQIRTQGLQFSNDSLQASFNLAQFSVIGKDNFLNTPNLIILGGTSNGLRDGLPVVDSHGNLVGTTENCQVKVSSVMLSPNHDSRIGARVAGTDWDGVVEGNRDLRAVLEMLPLESQIKSGDQVVTDNRNPDIPEGLVIGTASLVKDSDDHLFKEVVLDLPWDTNDLDQVWVITGRK